MIPGFVTVLGIRTGSFSLFLNQIPDSMYGLFKLFLINWFRKIEVYSVTHGSLRQFKIRKAA